MIYVCTFNKFFVKLYLDTQLYLDMKSLEELTPFINDRKSAAIHFGVSDKTISRWMKKLGLYLPKKNYGTKLNLQKAQEIRVKYSNGSEIKDLAKEYEVTFSTISRIIDNISYKTTKDTATVTVIYNPC